VADKRRILIVEDEPNMRELVVARLELAGYEVEQAPDGYDGLTKFRNKNFDLVVLDLMLPKLDGYTICRMIKSSEKSKTPVILYSARSAPDDARHGIDMGADAFVQKPFGPTSLLEKIEELLNPKPAEPEPAPAQTAATEPGQTGTQPAEDKTQEKPTSTGTETTGATQEETPTAAPQPEATATAENATTAQAEPPAPTASTEEKQPQTTAAPPQAQPEPQPKTQPEPQPKDKPEPQPKAQPEPKPKDQPKPEPKPKAESVRKEPPKKKVSWFWRLFGRR